MKTKETLKLENLLFCQYGQSMGHYACFEVTFGDRSTGNGDTERVDYVTYENQGNTFRCYEIKVSKQDFMSEAKKTFWGDFNYFVMPRELYQKLLDENNQLLIEYFWYGVGVIVTTSRPGGLEIIKKPKRKQVALYDKIHMMESMMKSMSRYVSLGI